MQQIEKVINKAEIGPITIRIDRLPYSLSPSAELVKRWKTESLSDALFKEDYSQEIAGVIGQRKGTFPEEILTVTESSSAHYKEALDYSNPENIRRLFCYLENPLHARRIRMITDLVRYTIDRALNNSDKIKIVDFGSGIPLFEREILKTLDPEKRKRIIFVGVDVSEDLLTYGLAQGYLDQGFVMDVMNQNNIAESIGQVDILVIAELLEHLRSPAYFLKENIAPWLKVNSAVFIGSVPNAVQFAEIPLILGASGSPHQLMRSLFDPDCEHRSFFTYYSLGQVLKFMGIHPDQISIVSNGVRLNADGNEADFNAGLEGFTHLGDRLIYYVDTNV